MDNLTMTKEENLPTNPVIEDTQEIRALVQALEALPPAAAAPVLALVAGVMTEVAPAPAVSNTLHLPKPAAPAAAAAAAEVPLPDELMLNILQTKRAHTSVGDTNFRLWLHAEFKKLSLAVQVADQGSMIVQVGKKSTTMFSCHVDTCHSIAESDGSRQKLAFDGSFGHVFLSDKASSGCLGGDDGVGVYIMLKMMKAKVKGTYVFHVGEERGGIGANAILKQRAPWLKDFDRCIAFDRAVKHGEEPEVILTQGGKSCASLVFGAQLVAALNEHPFDNPWVISHGGTFTDSKVYSDIIPECVNLGCFYLYQHTSKEVVDAWGVEKLLAACIKIKWDSLKAVRVPEAPKPFAARQYGKGYFQYGRGGRGMEGFDEKQFGFGGMDSEQDFYDAAYEARRAAAYDENRVASPAAKPILPASPFKTTAAAVPTHRSTFVELMDYSKDEIVELIDADPTIAADMMCLLLAKYKGLKAEVEALEEFLGV